MSFPESEEESYLHVDLSGGSYFTKMFFKRIYGMSKRMPHYKLLDKIEAIEVKYDIERKNEKCLTFKHMYNCIETAGGIEKFF